MMIRSLIGSLKPGNNMNTGDNKSCSTEYTKPDITGQRKMSNVQRTEHRKEFHKETEVKKEKEIAKVHRMLKRIELK